MSKIVVYRSPDFLTMATLRRVEDAAEQARESAAMSADSASAALTAQGGIADMLADTREARDAAQSAQGLAEDARDAAALSASAAADSAALVIDKTPIGEGQEWRNLIRARAAGEEYENTTGRTIQVNLTGKSTAAEGRAVETKQGAGAWVPVGYLPGSAAPVDGSASFTVPAAGGYRVNGPATIRYWSELRTLIDPATLFANGERGVWYDPSDLSSMFQDAAGTIPAVYGQPVGLILDKSGNGNHASQATATARPTLMQDGEGRAYLHCDGVDDVLTRPWTLGWAAPAEVYWLGQSNGTSGAGIGGLGIQYQQLSTRFGTLVSGNWGFGAPTATGRETLSAMVGNMSAVAVRGGSATDDLMVVYRDGVVLASKVPGVALGTEQSGTLMVGDAAYQATFYGGVMIFRELTSAERAQLVDYFHGASA